MGSKKPKKINRILRVPSVGQKNTKTCWIACYEMMCMYKVKQRGYATKKLKDAGLPMNIDLDSKNWKKARDTLGLDSIAATKLNDLDMIDWYLGKCGPLCCFGDYLDEGGHAILVSGIFWDTELLRIHDPWVLATKGEIDTMGLGIWYKRLSKRNYSVQLWW